MSKWSDFQKEYDQLKKRKKKWEFYSFSYSVLIKTEFY